MSFLCCSEQTAAFVACIGSVLSIGVVWVFVPQRTKKSQGKGKYPFRKLSFIRVFRPFIVLLDRKGWVSVSKEIHQQIVCFELGVVIPMMI